MGEYKLSSEISWGRAERIIEVKTVDEENDSISSNIVKLKGRKIG